MTLKERYNNLSMEDAEVGIKMLILILIYLFIRSLSLSGCRFVAVYVKLYLIILSGGLGDVSNIIGC